MEQSECFFNMLMQTGFAFPDLTLELHREIEFGVWRGGKRKAVTREMIACSASVI
jgi:hypothetical protein